jgi:hypothetical protein
VKCRGRLAALATASWSIRCDVPVSHGDAASKPFEVDGIAVGRDKRGGLRFNGGTERDELSASELVEVVHTTRNELAERVTFNDASKCSNDSHSHVGR